jgi:hypothetical protein
MPSAHQEELVDVYNSLMANVLALGKRLGVEDNRGSSSSMSKPAKTNKKESRAKKKAEEEAKYARGMPRKPPTGYVMFSGETRPTLSPALRPNEVMAELGRMWKLDEARRDEYNTKATALKAKYEEEMATWLESEGGSESDDASEKTKAKKKKKKKKKKAEKRDREEESESPPAKKQKVEEETTDEEVGGGSEDSEEE